MYQDVYEAADDLLYWSDVYLNLFYWYLALYAWFRYCKFLYCCPVKRLPVAIWTTYEQHVRNVILAWEPNDVSNCCGYYHILVFNLFYKMMYCTNTDFMYILILIQMFSCRLWSERLKCVNCILQSTYNCSTSFRKNHALPTPATITTTAYWINQDYTQLPHASLIRVHLCSDNLYGPS